MIDAGRQAINRLLHRLLTGDYLKRTAYNTPSGRIKDLQFKILILRRLETHHQSFCGRIRTHDKIQQGLSRVHSYRRLNHKGVSIRIPAEVCGESPGTRRPPIVEHIVPLDPGSRTEKPRAVEVPRDLLYAIGIRDTERCSCIVVEVPIIELQDERIAPGKRVFLVGDLGIGTGIVFRGSGFRQDPVDAWDDVIRLLLPPGIRVEIVTGTLVGIDQCTGVIQNLEMQVGPIGTAGAAGRSEVLAFRNIIAHTFCRE